MELQRLNLSTFLPDAMVEGYNSLIWTERFRENGEFELRSSKISAMRSLIPPDTLLTLRDSREVMIVESNNIKADVNGVKQLIVKGRTVETFLAHRPSIVLSGAMKKLPKAYTATDAALAVIWNAVVNATQNDLIGGVYIGNTWNVLPNVRASDSVTTPGSTKNWYAEPGNAYDFLQKILVAGQLGIRNLRPNGSTSKLTSFDTTIPVVAATGTVTKTSTANVPYLCMDVYQGKDRSKGQTANAQVVFHTVAGNVLQPEYLWSKEKLKNVGFILSTTTQGEIYWDSPWPAYGSAGGPTGWQRRILTIDAGSQVDGQDVQLMTDKAQGEVQQYRDTFFFDGEISPNTQYKYGQDYFLGDKVSVMGEYSTDETVFVSEYIRSEDEEGERAYPTLVVSL